MTALMASFSMVASRQAGGSSPSVSCEPRRVAPSMARTRSSVGGTMGSPSDH